MVSCSQPDTECAEDDSAKNTRERIPNGDSSIVAAKQQYDFSSHSTVCSECSQIQSLQKAWHSCELLSRLRVSSRSPSKNALRRLMDIVLTGYP
jgi:hypothetical protein